MDSNSKVISLWFCQRRNYIGFKSSDIVTFVELKMAFESFGQQIACERMEGREH